MEQVRRLRQAKRWKQRDLAYHADLATSVISQIENGKRDPSMSTLRKLAQALEVDIPDLFDRTDFPKAQSPLWSADISPEERAVIETIEELNEQLAAVPRDDSTMIAIGLSNVYRVGRLLPALMQIPALAGEMRESAGRMAELGRELLSAAQRSGEPPENAEEIGQVIDATERFRAA